MINPPARLTRPGIRARTPLSFHGAAVFLVGRPEEERLTMIHLLLAYVGPETMLPLTSVVAGAVGMAMMFGRNVLRGIGRVLRRPTRPR